MVDHAIVLFALIRNSLKQLQRAEQVVTLRKKYLYVTIFFAFLLYSPLWFLYSIFSYPRLQSRSSTFNNIPACNGNVRVFNL